LYKQVSPIILNGSILKLIISISLVCIDLSITINDAGLRNSFAFIFSTTPKILESLLYSQKFNSFSSAAGIAYRIA